MSTTPNIGLEILAEGQANKEASITEAHQQLDVLVQAAVIDRDLTAPPGGSPGPQEGDLYLVASGASGDWAGQDGDFAHYRNGAWTFITPKEGWRIWVKDEKRLLIFNGTVWTEITGGGGAGAFTGFHGDGLALEAVEEADGTSETLEVLTTSTPSSIRRMVCCFKNVIPEVDGDQVTVSFIMDDDTELSTVSLQFWRENGDVFDEGEAIGTSLMLGTLGNATGEFLNFEIQLLSANGPEAVKFLKARRTQIDANGARIWQEYLVKLSSTKSVKGFRLNTESPGDMVMAGTAELWIAGDGSGRVVEDASTGRTLTRDDNNRILYFTGSASPPGVTITVPGALPVGFICRVHNATGGDINLAAGGSPAVTLLGASTIPDGRAAELWVLNDGVAAVHLYAATS